MAYKTKDAKNANARKRRREIKQEVFENYGGKCNCCGESFSIDFLTLDHVNNDSSMHRYGPNRKWPGEMMYRWAKRNDYPDSLQLLCWNCNYGKFANGGTCPHKLQQAA